MRQFQNVLIVRTDRIGDVVLTTPAIAAVRANLPSAKITVLVSSNTRDLLEGNPHIDEIIVEDRKKSHKGWSGFWKLVGDIKRRRFDCAMVFHTKRRTNLLCFLSGIPCRIGYRDKNYGFLLTEGLKDERHLGRKHESQYCLDLLGHLGFRTEGFVPLLPVNAQSQGLIDRWIKDNHSTGSKIIAVHPGASDPVRFWPTQSYAQLIERLSSIPGCVIIVCGTGESVRLAREIRQKCSAKFHDLTGQMSLSQTVALLKRSHLLISSDSGPVHLASALGIYVITLFLRNLPGVNVERWGPLGKKGFVLLAQPGKAAVAGQEGTIAVEDVEQLAKDLMDRP